MERKIWIRNFEPGSNRKGNHPEYIDGNNNHRATWCDDLLINPSVGFDSLTTVRAKRGIGSHVSGVYSTPAPCSDYTLRHYPTWDGQFNLGVLIMFWVYIDVDDYKSFVSDRFSPLTAKGRFPKESEGEQIFTTHILQDGTMDIGHANMSSQSGFIKVPLKRWHLESMYIRNSETETIATIWIGSEQVAEGAARGTRWVEAKLRHWHMGLYGDNNGRGRGGLRPFEFYNDHIQIIDEVDSLNEAQRLIEEELSGESILSSPKNFRITN